MVADPPEGAMVCGYKLECKISSTRNSIVYLTSDPETNQRLVIKFIKIKENKTNRIINEVNLMSNCNHPNIVKALKFFQYDCFYCVVMDYASEGSLKQYLLRYYKKGIPEEMVKKIVIKMLMVLKYLKDNEIIHRDIKLENFLVFKLTNDEIEVKLSDFGFASYFSEQKNEFVGTFGYESPEILQNKRYSYEIDMWSLGVCVFVLLTCKYPFPVKNLLAHKKKVLKGIFRGDWITSDKARDFISSLLVVKPKNRMTPEEALTHCWISDEITNNVYSSFTLTPENYESCFQNLQMIIV